MTRLDRLARSTRDLLNTLAAVGAAKAAFRSLHDACELDELRTEREAKMDAKRKAEREAERMAKFGP